MSNGPIFTRPAALGGWIVMIGAWVGPAAAGPTAGQFSGMSFIDNGQIRLGVNLDIA